MTSKHQVLAHAWYDTEEAHFAKQAPPNPNHLALFANPPKKKKNKKNKTKKKADYKRLTI